MTLNTLHEQDEKSKCNPRPDKANDHIMVLQSTDETVINSWAKFQQLYTDPKPFKFFHVPCVVDGDTSSYYSLSARGLERKTCIGKSIVELMRDGYIMTCFNDSVFKDGELAMNITRGEPAVKMRIVLHYSTDCEICEKFKSTWNKVVNERHTTCEFRATSIDINYTECMNVSLFNTAYRGSKLPFIFGVRRTNNFPYGVDYCVLFDNQINEDMLKILCDNKW